MSDPREAKTLGEACKNADGETYNGIRALSWLSGFSEAEVTRLVKAAMEKRNGNR